MQTGTPIQVKYIYIYSYFAISLAICIRCDEAQLDHTFLSAIFNITILDELAVSTAPCSLRKFTIRVRRFTIVIRKLLNLGDLPLGLGKLPVVLENSLVG